MGFSIYFYDLNKIRCEPYPRLSCQLSRPEGPIDLQLLIWNRVVWIFLIGDQPTESKCTFPFPTKNYIKYSFYHHPASLVTFLFSALFFPSNYKTNCPSNWPPITPYILIIRCSSQGGANLIFFWNTLTKHVFFARNMEE